MRTLRVLIVEDSEDDVFLIIRHLRKAGFDVIQTRVETAREMIAALDQHSWDLIIADYSLPQFSGLDALEITKQNGSYIPFIIVSGVIGEDTAVAVMKAGAHDYISKKNLDRLIPAVERELDDAITHRKRQEAEAALRKSEQRFRLIVENSPFPIGIINKEINAFEYINPQFSFILGYELSEIQNLNEFFLKAFPSPIQGEFVINSWQRTLDHLTQGVLIQPQDFDVVCKNGTHRTMVFHIINLEEEKVYVLLEDITEIKNAERKLQGLYEETVAISKMKSDLITFTSHELKTPLVPILGWSEFIKNALEKGQQIEKLISLEEITSIFNSATRLHQIITNFLDIQRIEADRLDLRFESHSIVKIILNAISNVRELADKRGIQFIQEFDDFELELDAFRIEQVLTNIFANSIKYSSPESTVTIKSFKEKDVLHITVKDSGVGFTPEEIRDVGILFSPTGLQRKEKDPSTGAGVGLYLAKTILAHHGGRLDVLSEGRNKGSLIEITLPLHQTARPEFPQNPNIFA